MQIQKIQSNQTTFGTRVRISPRMIKFIDSDTRRIVKRDLETLRNNGNDDFMFLSVHHNDNVYKNYVQADIMEIKSNHSQQLGTAECELYSPGKTISVIDLYEKAKASTYKSQVNMSDWLQYI
jgi:hypothetical protein